MKIALCKTYLAGPVSGADEVVVNYAIALHEAGHNVEVVLVHQPDNDDLYYARLKSTGVPVSSVIERSVLFAFLRRVRDLLFSIFFFLFLVPGLQKFLRRSWQSVMNLFSHLHLRQCRLHFKAIGADLLHVVTPDSGALTMIRAGHELGIPVLYHELGTPHYLPALDLYYRRLEKVLPLCTEVAALSPLLASQWLERLPFLKSVSALPLTVVGCDGAGDETAEKSGTTVFGFAARIEEGKGPLVLVRALGRLNLESTPAKVKIAGSGPQLAEVERATRQLGLGDACEFLGTYKDRESRKAFMSSIDVLVLPSFAEGTPNCIVEAMAEGRPVIASEVGGIPDMICADSGILVPPGDDQALADAMLKLASDPELRARMGRAARKRYLQNYSPEAVLPALERTYHRLLRRPEMELEPLGLSNAARPSEAAVKL